MENRDTHAVRVRLEATPEDLRGWEWHFLMSRLDESLLVTDGISHCVSPDGEGFLVLEESGRVFRWDPGGGERMTVREAGTPNSFAWLAPSGTHRLTATLDPDVEHRWIVRAEPLPPGGETLETAIVSRAFADNMQNHVLGTAPYRTSTLFPDLLYWGDDRGLRVRSLRTGSDRRAGLVPGAEVAGFGAGKGRILLSSEHAARLEIFEWPALERLYSWHRSRNRTVRTAVWIMDKIFTGLSDNSTELISETTGEPVAWGRVSGHTAVINAVAASADGELLASGGQDRVVRLLDAETGHVKRTYHGHEKPVVGLSFSADNEYLLSQEASGKLRIWSARGEDPSVLSGHESYVYDVRFSPDGHRVYSAGWDAYVDADGAIRVWDATTREAIAAFGGRDRCAYSLSVFPDGSKILTAGGQAGQEWLGGDLCVWSADTGELLETHPGSFRRASLSPDGRRAAATDLNGTMTVLELEDGRRLFENPVTKDGHIELAPAFSPDGRYLVGPDGDGTVLTIWETQEFRKVRTLRGHQGFIAAVAFSPDGEKIVTGSHDLSFIVWDAATGTQLGVQSGHGDEVLSVAFDPAGERILTGGRDLSVRIWDADSLEEMVRLAGHRSYVIGMAVEPRTRAVASASGDGTVRLWDTRPLRQWHLARAQRRSLVAELGPRIDALFEELDAPERVVSAVRETYSGRREEVALQIVLRKAVARRK
jgi:WD40 repeat protein